jgi:hypothetical protein
MNVRGLDFDVGGRMLDVEGWKFRKQVLVE